MRSKLGESLSSIEKYGTPLPEATTSSLEALRAYSMGNKAERTEGATASLPSSNARWSSIRVSRSLTATLLSHTTI